jgi:lipopolysaccharide transport system ATP-binding protein
MSELAIKVENLSKLYRLGIVGTGSLKHDIKRWWYTQILKEEDPYLKIGSTNLRNQKADSEYVWALKDINFELEKGQALGIVGSNGSGKSTLLKILSRVTAPTTGIVKVKGRVASLLEVGTGFHGELSGRHNIFLNGSIMGMTKSEIKSKFDEIVEFSGVERYIDTPVKRYSSGMYVRLAFAVAAHLEPDILIVDEVLAVGDADFQKKCLGKMHDASEKEGRTVLFVSHNMQAVKSLCTKAVLMQDGNIIEEGYPDHVINRYLSNVSKNSWEQYYKNVEEAPGNEHLRVKRFQVIPQNIDYQLEIKSPFKVLFQFWNLEPGAKITLVLVLHTISGECVFTSASGPEILEEGIAEGEWMIPGNLLNSGSYALSIHVNKNISTSIYVHKEDIVFELEDLANTTWFGKQYGVIRPKIPHSLKMIQPLIIK